MESFNYDSQLPQKVIRADYYYKKLIKSIELLDFQSIDHAVNLIRAAWQDKKQIICFGNGGSALTAQHFINDWNKSVFLASGKPFRGRCLTENMGLVTAYANDVCYQDIFIEQLKNILEPGDLVIGISGSGNSPNIIKAIEQAKLRGAKTIGLLGFTTGGKAKSLVDYEITVQNDHYGRIEDIHSIIQHIIISYFTKLKP